ncbi:hypothetical protein LTR49_021496 [Elasticomyces elasticus]|nr:hypothetical protein LTR49_021496 [Elasticomyces elasticus]KAK5753512.1 hypothetical protein LTS12_016352 [Elasticomyces elasticus]
MSLNDSLRAFKSERADAVSRNIQSSRPAASTPTPRTSTPKPSDTLPNPSNNVPVSGEVMTYVLYAVDRLRASHPKPQVAADLLLNISLPLNLRGPVAEAKFKRALSGHFHAQIINAKSSPNGKESFKYRPLHPVMNGDELRDYLARLDSASGVSVKDLKDGWPDCIPTITLLESRAWHLTTPVDPKNPGAAHKLMEISPDFLKIYSSFKLPPNGNDLIAELQGAGLVPTSAVKEVKSAGGKKKERKRVERRNAKKTNTHMAGVLKDYSKVKAAKAAGT